MQLFLELYPWSDKRNVGVGLLLSILTFFSTIIILDTIPKKKKPYQHSYDFSNIYSLSPTALASALHFPHISYGSPLRNKS